MVAIDRRMSNLTRGQGQLGLRWEANSFVAEVQIFGGGEGFKGHIGYRNRSSAISKWMSVSHKMSRWCSHS